MKILKNILAGITIWSLPVVTLAHTTDGHMEGGHHMMDWFGWGAPGAGFLGLLGIVTWLVWLVVGVLLIIWLIKRINKE